MLNYRTGFFLILLKKIMDEKSFVKQLVMLLNNLFVSTLSLFP